MPFYEVKTEGEERKRLVEAPSAPAAIMHCARGKYTTRTLANLGDLADLFAAGVTVEKAGEAPAVEGAPESDK
jgi:hypothetical protein